MALPTSCRLQQCNSGCKVIGAAVTKDGVAISSPASPDGGKLGVTTWESRAGNQVSMTLELWSASDLLDTALAHTAGPGGPRSPTDNVAPPNSVIWRVLWYRPEAPRKCTFPKPGLIRCFWAPLQSKQGVAAPCSVLASAPAVTHLCRTFCFSSRQKLPAAVLQKYLCSFSTNIWVSCCQALSKRDLWCPSWYVQLTWCGGFPTAEVATWLHALIWPVAAVHM